MIEGRKEGRKARRTIQKERKEVKERLDLGFVGGDRYLGGRQQ
jgi:hypothetical protein